MSLKLAKKLDHQLLIFTLRINVKNTVITKKRSVSHFV